MKFRTLYRSLLSTTFAIAFLTLGSTVSRADVFDFTLAGAGSFSDITGSGVITATAVGDGVYGITDISGVFSDPYTGVIGNITDPFAASSGRSTSSDNLWYYDNLLYIAPGTQFIDNANGWLFDVNGTDEVNIWGNGAGSNYTEMVSTDHAGYPNWGQPLDVDVVSQTPEPSSLVLLGTGLIGLAGVARRKFLTT